MEKNVDPHGLCLVALSHLQRFPVVFTRHQVGTASPPLQSNNTQHAASCVSASKHFLSLFLQVCMISHLPGTVTALLTVTEPRRGSHTEPKPRKCYPQDITPPQKRKKILEKVMEGGKTGMWLGWFSTCLT